MPLSAFTRFGAGNTPIAVYHDNLFAASTISFRLATGVSIGEATAAVISAGQQRPTPITCCFRCSNTPGWAVPTSFSPRAAPCAVGATAWR